MEYLRTRQIAGYDFENFVGIIGLFVFAVSSVLPGEWHIVVIGMRWFVVFCYFYLWHEMNKTYETLIKVLIERDQHIMEEEHYQEKYENTNRELHIALELLTEEQCKVYRERLHNI